MLPFLLIVMHIIYKYISVATEIKKKHCSSFIVALLEDGFIHPLKFTPGREKIAQLLITKYFGWRLKITEGAGRTID